MKISTIENEGHGVLKLLFSKMGWAYREQPVQDVGVDAHIELTDDNGRSRGKLIGLQVKAGPSFFQEETADAFVFRTDASHAGYWKSHSLPVLLVLVDLANARPYYTLLNEETVASTGKGFKVHVPKANVLTPKAADTLAELAEGSEEVQRYRTLALATDLMAVLENGGTVFLEAEEWMHKSSGRGSLKLVVDDGSGEKVERDWGFIAPGWDYGELFKQIVPWADIEVDEEVYYDEELSQFQSSEGTYDSEDDAWFYDQEGFVSWRESLPAIRPYAEEAGEVAKYRLRLILNELGTGFLAVNRFIESREHWNTRKALWKED